MQLLSYSFPLPAGVGRRIRRKKKTKTRGLRSEEFKRIAKEEENNNHYY